MLLNFSQQLRRYRRKHYTRLHTQCVYDVLVVVMMRVNAFFITRKCNTHLPCRWFVLYVYSFITNHGTIGAAHKINYSKTRLKFLRWCMMGQCWLLRQNKPWDRPSKVAKELSFVLNRIFQLPDWLLCNSTMAWFFFLLFNATSA